MNPEMRFPAALAGLAAVLILVLHVAASLQTFEDGSARFNTPIVQLNDHCLQPELGCSPKTN